MFERLFIGEKRLNLVEVDSTNAFIKQMLSASDNEFEGLVVSADNQLKGRGQQGSSWFSESGKNLTFSILLKPNILVHNQFILSKVISLGIVDFLLEKKINNVKIKWPNDVYVGSRKIAGILIENTLKNNKVSLSIVGIGLNVNQSKFDTDNSPASLKNVLGEEFDLEITLNQLLFFIERRYIDLKQQKEQKISADYLGYLFGLREELIFEVNGARVSGRIEDVSQSGKLQVLINSEIKEFDLKEIKLVLN